MKRFLAILLCVSVISSSLLYAQPILNLPQDLLMLRTELQLAKESLKKLNEQVLLLEQSLLEARQSQQISEQRISDLEASLNEAVKQRDQLQSRVDSLQEQLTALSKSLADSKLQIQLNEENQIKEIQKLTQGFQLRLTVNKVVIGVVVGVAILEAGWILYRELTR